MSVLLGAKNTFYKINKLSGNSSMNRWQVFEKKAVQTAERPSLLQLVIHEMCVCVSATLPGIV